jgi:hypothetical protein
MLRHTRYTAPSLSLFVPNSLTVSRHSFLPRAVLGTSVIGLSHGDHSPSATTVPSLDQLVLSGSLISYQQVRVITVVQILRLYYLTQHNHPKILSIYLSHTTVGAVTHGEASAPTYPALTPVTISFSQGPYPYFS